jgi:uncharacterized membrane protein
VRSKNDGGMMHTLIKYGGAGFVVAIAAIVIFNRVFAERPVWQGKAVTIGVGVITLALFIVWLLWSYPSVAEWWPQM